MLNRKAEGKEAVCVEFHGSADRTIPSKQRSCIFLSKFAYIRSVGSEPMGASLTNARQYTEGNRMVRIRCGEEIGAIVAIVHEGMV
jgi:hypothetical protein